MNLINKWVMLVVILIVNKIYHNIWNNQLKIEYKETKK
jgi:hypothetical protein